MVCKELAGASTKESVPQTWCEILRIEDEELKGRIFFFIKISLIGSSMENL